MYLVDSLYIAERKDASLFTSNNDFMAYCVELHKEFFVFFTLVQNIEGVYDDLVEIKKAVLFGLLRKLENLNLDYLNILCNGSVDAALILMRTLKEVLVNVSILIDKYDDDFIFSDYIKSSLITEKNFYDFLVKDDDDPQMQDEPSKSLRERMKKSIESSFENSGIDVDALVVSHERKNNFWQKTKIMKRFELAGFSTMYESYRLDCHAMHGNWQNIYSVYLLKKSNGFEINYNKRIPDPRCVLPMIMFHGMVLADFITRFIVNDELKSALQKILNDCLDEVKKVDRVHLDFLKNKAVAL